MIFNSSSIKTKQDTISARIKKMLPMYLQKAMRHATSVGGHKKQVSEFSYIRRRAHEVRSLKTQFSQKVAIDREDNASCFVGSDGIGEDSPFRGAIPKVSNVTQESSSWSSRGGRQRLPALAQTISFRTW